jgi:hypothetical protein
MVLGMDYQVYVCVAILHFLHHDITRHAQDRELIVFLKVDLFSLAVFFLTPSLIGLTTVFQMFINL